MFVVARHNTTTSDRSEMCMINEKRNVSVCAPIFRSVARFFSSFYFLFRAKCKNWPRMCSFSALSHAMSIVRASSGSMSYRRMPSRSLRILFHLRFFFRSLFLLTCFTMFGYAQTDASCCRPLFIFQFHFGMFALFRIFICERMQVLIFDAVLADKRLQFHLHFSV